MTEVRDFHVYSPDSLPNGMIGLATAAGQSLSKEAEIINERMIEIHFNQIHRTYCGPVSLAMLVNAIGAAYRIKYDEVKDGKEPGSIRLTEADIINIMKESPLKLDKVDVVGMTLEELANVAMYLGFGVNTYFPVNDYVSLNSSSEQTLMKKLKENRDILKFSTFDEFRELAKMYIARLVTGLIVNYDMSMLGYKELRGHFSPLAAYHKETDRFLIMDVWPDTPSAWVLAKDLYQAVSTVDSASGLPRGLLRIYELL